MHRVHTRTLPILDRVEIVIEPEVSIGCEGLERILIDEDVSERLDVTSAKFRVIVWVAQAAAPGCFLADGEIEIDSNAVERAIRPRTITRENSLFAGSDGGGHT